MNEGAEVAGGGPKGFGGGADVGCPKGFMDGGAGAWVKAPG